VRLASSRIVFPAPHAPRPAPRSPCRIESGENGNPTVNTLLRYARAIGRKINVALVEADPVKA